MLARHVHRTAMPKAGRTMRGDCSGEMVGTAEGCESARNSQQKLKPRRMRALSHRAELPARTQPEPPCIRQLIHTSYNTSLRSLEHSTKSQGAAGELSARESAVGQSPETGFEQAGCVLGNSSKYTNDQNLRKRLKIRAAPHALNKLGLQLKTSHPLRHASLTGQLGQIFQEERTRLPRDPSGIRTKRPQTMLDGQHSLNPTDATRK